MWSTNRQLDNGRCEEEDSKQTIPKAFVGSSEILKKNKMHIIFTLLWSFEWLPGNNLLHGTEVQT